MNIETFINSNTWKYAKSYSSSAPHEYVVRQDIRDQKAFVDFVEYIRANGFRAKFWSLSNIYYEHDGYYYWTMGAPIEETIIINRCKVEEYEITEHKVFGKIMRWSGDGKQL